MLNATPDWSQTLTALLTFAAVIASWFANRHASAERHRQLSDQVTNLQTTANGRLQAALDEIAELKARLARPVACPLIKQRRKAPAPPRPRL